MYMYMYMYMWRGWKQGRVPISTICTVANMVLFPPMIIRSQYVP